MTSIAITGASGFVGKQVIKYLLRKHHDLRVIVRDGKELDFVSNIEIINTEDLFSQSLENLKEMVKGVETLIHIAWYTEPGKYLTSPLNLSCMMGTLNLAQAFKQAGGKRFVGVGTCFEYDFNQGFLNTDTPLNPQTLYAACKTSTFQILTQLLPTSGVEFLWCRLFYLYGEGEDSRRLVPYLKEKLQAGEVAELSSGNQIRDFLDVQEAGRMIAEAALSSTQGAVNICSGVPITVRQMAEKIADEFGRRDLLHFGARPDNLVDPPCIVGVQSNIGI